MLFDIVVMDIGMFLDYIKVNNINLTLNSM